MDKRKANGGGAGEEVDDRAAKRRKFHDEVDMSKGETAGTTTRHGLLLLEKLRETKDKSGRIISTAFLTLPNKRQVPDYYKVTKMPIALDTIEAKLNSGDFPNLASLESYFKRMIVNAREYNQKGSEIYDDAERLRKALSNFMTKWNPAYKTPGYVPVPTPLPTGSDAVSEVESEREATPEPAPPATATRRQRARAQKSSTPEPDIPSFQGLTFQQAQEKIVQAMLRKKEFPTDEFTHFEPFVSLPNKSQYRDYYRLISNPVSLNTLQQHIKGIHPKSSTRGVSDYKHWAAFEEEVSGIWLNADKYNEPGSDISVLAKDLEEYFQIIFQKAKAAIPEPAGPKIKLKVPANPPKFTLKFDNKAGKATPANSPAPQVAPPEDGVRIVNGSVRRDPIGGTHSHSSATPGPTLNQLERARSASGSAVSPSPSVSAQVPVKNEEFARNSPAIVATRGSGQAAMTSGLAAAAGMLPPSTPGLPNTYSQGGYAQSFNHQSHYQQPNPSFDSKWRQPGKDTSDAMITSLGLVTHPGLNIPRHFRMDLPPSSAMAQQSITINLPSTHYYLQIKPQIAASLLERQYKLFVTSGTQRLHAMPTIPGHAVDPRNPLFEARLLPGVNRIEVELIAALPKGAPKPANGQDVELEKITVFANLMRS